MTPAEIDAMPAGPEMNELIARYVFGAYTLISEDGSAFRDIKFPPYSTSDAAALEVFKKMAEDPHRFDAIRYDPNGGWEVGRWDYEWMGTPSACAPTLALAICRAALKAVGR